MEQLPVGAKPVPPFGFTCGLPRGGQAQPTASGMQANMLKVRVGIVAVLFLSLISAHAGDTAMDRSALKTILYIGVADLHCAASQRLSEATRREMTRMAASAPDALRHSVGAEVEAEFILLGQPAFCAMVAQHTEADAAERRAMKQPALVSGPAFLDAVARDRLGLYAVRPDVGDGDG